MRKELETLEKILNTMIKRKYPDDALKIKITEELIYDQVYNVNVYVILEKYESIYKWEEMEQMVKNIARFSGVKINRVISAQEQ
jgi:hypothetical protein